MWKSADGQTHNMVDHVLISSKLRSSVTNSHAFPIANVGSFLQLLLADIRLKLKARKSHSRIHTFDTRKLNDPSIVAAYESIASKRLVPISDALDNEKYGCIDQMWGKVVVAFNDSSSSNFL